MKEVLIQLMEHVKWLRQQIEARDKKIESLTGQIARLEHIIKFGPDAP